jgi:lipopolysaccharide transport system ATP-binding protein
MSNTVIKVENLSKQYRLGEIGTGSLSHDINRWWHRIRGKENPYLKIGETNDRSTKSESEYVWSLKDINFEIEQGDAVGIIGRNGAGKSTLLKILSRVTGPTTGSVKVKGRIASLLEVGTGFHPELSGRDNIFLNGAILGMRKHEIQKKFDEIVDFSGVERYINTPVKRYSSGMYVRLAFAVAAHLESEILLVDEVLAVGDYEFQKKCLGKMNEVSKGEGRTVLFVSHNMGSIKGLCNRGIYLKNGMQEGTGYIESIAQLYLNDAILTDGEEKCAVAFQNTIEKQACITSLSISNKDGLIKSEFDVFEQIILIVKYSVNETSIGMSPILDIKRDGIDLFYSLLSDIDESVLEGLKPGEYEYKVTLPYPLKKGRYSLSFRLSKLKVGNIDTAEDAITFYIEEFSFDPTNKSYSSTRKGQVVTILDWEKV